MTSRTAFLRSVRARLENFGSKPFSKRNPLPIGIVGIVLAAVVLWFAFNPDDLPFVGGGTTYSAYFTEDAGLKSGDDVRIAGVKVGSVTSVKLDHAQVKVTFTVKNAFVGDQSTAAIDIKTLLGAKYLGVDSIGTRALTPSDTIPASRTTSPFDIYPAITQLTDTLDNINTAQLAKAFDTLSADFKGTPADVRAAIQGLTRLSETVSSRDAQLQQLLTRANQVTGVLANRDAQLQKLLSDGGLLLDELDSRRDAIHSLLVNTTVLSVQLEGLVADNQKTLAPLLNGLQSVLALLQKNQDSLDNGLALLGPYYRVINNVVGNGRWFDNYIENFNAAGIGGFLGLGG